MILIKNGYVYSQGMPGEGKMDILLDGGKIKAVGNNLENIKNDCEIIDAAGQVITPGLVEAHCHTGGALDSKSQVNEITGPVQAGLRISDAVDLSDPEFTRALKTGVCTMAVCPGSSNLIGGVSMAVKSAGDSYADRIINNELTIKMALGENQRNNYGKRNQSPSTRMGSAAIIRQQLFLAKEYKDRWEKYNQGEKNGFKFDMNMHSLMRVFDGMRVKIHAHQADDILTAIRISKEFGLNASIEHCTEGILVADEIKESGYPALVGPMLFGQGKNELWHMNAKVGGLFEEKGIRFAIITDNTVLPMDGLLMQACVFCKYGLSKQKALNALTIDAAWCIGLDDKVGSIEVGKDADIVIWNMHPLETLAKPECVIIDGKVRLRDGEVIKC